MPTRRKEIANELDKYKGLERLKDNKDGIILIDYLKEGLINEIDGLLVAYRDSSTNLIPIIARIDEKLTILRVLTKAENNKNIWLDILEKEEKREQTGIVD